MRDCSRGFWMQGRIPRNRHRIEKHCILVVRQRRGDQSSQDRLASPNQSIGKAKAHCLDTKAKLDSVAVEGILRWGGVAVQLPIPSERAAVPNLVASLRSGEGDCQIAHSDADCAGLFNTRTTSWRPLYRRVAKMVQTDGRDANRRQFLRFAEGRAIVTIPASSEESVGL